MKKGFELIAIFPFPQEMYIVREALENEGISCVVRDELSVQIINLLSNAFGGVKLYVHRNDFDRAKEIVGKAGFKPYDGPSLTPGERMIGKCIAWFKSLNVDKGKAVVIFLIVFTILLIGYFSTT